MLSKIAPKRVKESESQEYFANLNKIVNRTHKHEIEYGKMKAFRSQFVKRSDANIFKFKVDELKTKDNFLKELAKAMNPLNKVRKMEIVLCE